MLANTVLRAAVALVVLGWSGIANAQDRVKDHFNETALQVQAAEDPIEKREILSKSLADMTQAIEIAKSSPLISDEDDGPLTRLQSVLRERSDELAGTNGFDRVADEDLNAFSMYVVQDMEQAQTVTISVITLLLIIIIIILIA
jgi:hypothetical protein